MYKYSINSLQLSLCKLYVKHNIAHEYNTLNCDTVRVSKSSKNFTWLSALV